jgi:hypothetical protein
MSFYRYMFLNTLNETLDEPQNGSINIDLFIISGSIFGNNNFNSFLFFPKHPNGIVSLLGKI